MYASVPIFSQPETNNVVLNGITMKEELLSQEEFPLYEYNKNLRANKYPLFILNYIGGRSNEIPKHEITLGLNDIKQQIQAMKASVIRGKVGGI